MAIEISLDTISEQAQDSYADVVIPLADSAVILVNPMRLTDEKREELTEFIKSTGSKDEDGEDDESTEAEAKGAEDEEQVDPVEQAQSLIRIVAQTDEQAESLFAALGRDMTMYQTLVGSYFEAVNPGEA